MISTEFISAQSGLSPFAKDLMTIFQEVIDTRESITNLTSRVQLTISFFNKTSIPKLKSCIKKYTGFELNKVICSKSANGAFATSCNIYDKYGINMTVILDRIAGHEPMDYLDEIRRQYHIKTPTYDELKRISQSMNKETGVFSDVKLKDGSGVTMTLYFDPYMAFLIKETCYEKSEYLSAAEITAIVLHEVGHCVSTLAKAANMYFVSEVMNTNLDYFSKNASLKEKAKAIADAKNQKTSPTAKALLDKCSSVVDSMTAESSISGHSIIAFFQFIGSLVFVPIGLLFGAVVLPFTLLGDIFSGITSNWNSTKLSDFYNANKNIKYTEQLADEYCVKHGCGSYQLSALNKIYACGAWLEYGSVATRNCSVVHALVQLKSTLSLIYMTMTLGDLYAEDEHEAPTERIRTMLREELNLFKRGGLPPDLLDFYIEEYEKTMLTMSKIDVSTKAMEHAAAVRNLIAYIIKTPIQMLFMGRFSDEYSKLFTRVEQLQSNSLFYRAAKLMQLAHQKE